LFVVACLAGAAHADPKDEAEDLYRQGSKHYDLREYTAAIDAFKRAYELYPEPTFLFDIAQAYRLLDDCDNAAGFYRNYVRVKPDADDRDKAEQLAKEMESCAADRKQRAQPPPPVRRVVETRPANRGLRLAGIVTAGAGAAAAGVGIYFSLDAADKAHRVEQLCASGCNATDVASIDSSGKTSSQLAIAMYAVGGAALTAGAAMFIYATLHSEETVTVAPTPGGAAMSWAVRF
jgi:tetratricopeptide (TPR) repeat protein